MDTKELTEQLDKLGITISASRLQSWSRDGFIPRYESYYQEKPKKKRGRPSKDAKERERKQELNNDWAQTIVGIVGAKEREMKQKPPGRYSYWPPETLEQAAAIWAVLRDRKGITMKMVKIVKKQLPWVYAGGPVVYLIPPMTRSIAEVNEIKYTDIKLQLVLGITPEWSEATEKLFKDQNKEEKAEKKLQLLDELIKKWIATVAKVQYTINQRRWALWNGKPSHYVWPLDQGAIVMIVHRRKPVGVYADGQKVWGWQFESLEIGGKTEPGEPDTIFLFERVEGKPSVDTRALFLESLRFKEYKKVDDNTMSTATVPGASEYERRIKEVEEKVIAGEIGLEDFKQEQLRIAADILDKRSVTT